MKIYNSLTKQKEKFNSLEPGIVKMYVCGPTVYNYAHVGNLRPVVFFDVVYRYLTKAKYQVDYISNFTDVDDKIITKALENNVSEKEISEKYIKAYMEDLASLNCKEINDRPKVTDCMEEIIIFINELVEKGYAYAKEGNVYFSVSKIAEYGKVSNQTIDQLVSGSRINIDNNKNNPLDFTLWKKTNEGLKWDSPWGPGRPGWHTECVVMIDEHFRSKIDIHGGGMELKFPHHENEVAQSTAINNHDLANYWMHNAIVNIEGEKMSKSIGNVILVKDLLGDYGANVIRLALLSNHYRTPLNFSTQLLEEMQMLDQRLKSFFKKASLLVSLKTNEEITDYEEQFEDDFNIPNVVAIMNADLKNGNNALRGKNMLEIEKYYNRLAIITEVLGLKYQLEVKMELKEMYNDWWSLRENKDYAKADEIRIKLEEEGLL